MATRAARVNRPPGNDNASCRTSTDVMSPNISASHWP